MTLDGQPVDSSTFHNAAGGRLMEGAKGLSVCAVVEAYRSAGKIIEAIMLDIKFEGAGPGAPGTMIERLRCCSPSPEPKPSRRNHV